MEWGKKMKCLCRGSRPRNRGERRGGVRPNQRGPDDCKCRRQKATSERGKVNKTRKLTEKGREGGTGEPKSHLKGRPVTDQRVFEMRFGDLMTGEEGKTSLRGEKRMISRV